MMAKKWVVPAIFTLAMAVLIWAASAGPAILNGGYGQADRTLWQECWQVVTAQAATRPLRAPMRLAAGETAMVATLPGDIRSNGYVFVKTNYQSVQAQVDGVAVPVNGVIAREPRFACDSPWTSVALTPDMAGKTIRLTFSGTGSKPFVEVYAVHYGTGSRLQLALLRNALPTLALAGLTTLFAIGLYGFALLEARRHHKRLAPYYGYLVLFVAVCGVWIFTDSDIGGVDFMGSPGYLASNILSGMILPIPFLMFTYSLHKAYRRTSMVAMALDGAYILTQAVLWYSGRFLLWQATLLYQVLMGVTAVLLLLANARGAGEPIPNRALAQGINLVAMTGLLSIAMYYLLPMDDLTLVLRFGLLAFVASLTVSVLRSNVDILMQGKRFEELRIREEEYRIAVRQSDKYVIRFDVRKRAILQGDEPSPLFGSRQLIPDMPGTAIAEGMVADESIADFRDFFGAMLAGKENGASSACLRNTDGRFVWYHADYTMIYTNHGEPLQAVISFYDITDQREKELAFQKWKQAYTEMPEDGMNYYEYNLTRDTLTGEAGRMLPPLPAHANVTVGAMVEHWADNHVLPADDLRFRQFFDRARLLEAFGHGVRSDRLEFRRTDAQGASLWTQASVQLLSDPYSSDVQSFLLLKDIDGQKCDELRLRARSNTDPLTGLLNRTAFEEQLDELFAKTEEGCVHALIMMDVDGFKRVNDTFGHHFGDGVLVEIAGNLRAMMRGDDLIGRIGGDEYMVCLKNVKEGSGFLERRSAFLCQALNKQFGSDVAISGSVGLSLYPRDGRTFDELYRKADKALYFAKHHGKNRFVFYHEGLLQSDGNAPSAQSLLQSPVDPVTIARAQQASMRTLLIVDDVEMNRALLGEIFQNEYNLLFAQSGEEGMELLLRGETMVSAVLLDLMMPGMDGFEVLKRMQKDAYLASIPVIVTSAAGETEYSLKAIELGATDFVGKPVDPILVRLRVKNAVHKRETEELRAQNRYLLVQKSDESRHQDELRYLAEHDPLTNLSNKSTFYRKSKEMMDKEPNTTFVMVAFDIEKFRVINDIFGHAEGDRLLRYIAQRLQMQYSARAIFSRTDADNFAVCMPYDPLPIARRIAENEEELKNYDLPFDVVLVYGLYIIDDRTLPVSIMHDRAEMAKRTVKGNYVKRFAYYDETLRRALLDELEIVNNMNSALETNQFEVYLQPKCMLNTGEIVGAEALVRWNHPTRGVLTPGAFVPVFEKNGFIMKLDAWVWEQVCQLLRKWMDINAGKPLIPVSMNMSRVNLYNPALVGTLSALADRYGVPRRMMELEITESAYTEDPKQLSDLVTELRNRGFMVQMDDFGSAYSSLNMLKEISVDLLKLDMRFLFGNDYDGRGGTILSSIVRMARYLSLPIVAEGVETAEQARFLHSIGCGVGQGYYFHRAMPVADFETLLRDKPVGTLHTIADDYPESVMRRVWGIDGDFSLMLATIPCAATLCELGGDKIEILRINDEYLALTQDRLERVYRDGTDVRVLTLPEQYTALLALFRQAFAARGAREGAYTRLREDGQARLYHIKVTYLSGDELRALFFVTYRRMDEGRCDT